MKNFLSKLPFSWKQDKISIMVLCSFLGLLIISNVYGYRICNCTSTEKWEPGKARGARSHSGVHYFYHK
ncbi:hypothetical protein CLV59_105123 [Chitinophaga dinghuensis]|uniref:Uncharacterized protein n=1 Tax=Chitinophaga dinghuensis TaxID=1539050 RepID=A0A327VYK7_9BACT|nr:hypothetical protein [Chitinophaga dinghuensis]RAJ80016.1 hypothetical protein CLV59_105123 [Chitinophaga dinghuensis]